MKKKILFFPSAWSGEAIFLPQAHYLQEKFEVIFPDIHQFDNIESMSDFVAKTYKEVYAIIGLSMGGFIVQDLLIRYPDFAEKAVLMGTYAHAPGIEGKIFYDELIKKVKEGDFQSLCEAYANVMVSKARQQDKKLMEIAASLPKQLGAAVCINHHRACGTKKDYSEQLKAVNTRTLLLVGENDLATPIVKLEELNQLMPFSTLNIIKKAGHMLTLEEPIQVNHVLMDWLMN